MIDILPYRAQLKESPLFRDISEDEMRVLFEHMEHLCYEAGSEIITQGTENKGLWLLGDGCCEVVRSNVAGTKQQVLAMLGPGTVFGEMSFFHKTVHSASIRCVTAVTVHQLTQTAFAELQESNCSVASKVLTNLVRVLADRLQMMDQWICELMNSSTQTKVNKQDEWHDFRAKLYSEWDFS